MSKTKQHARQHTQLGALFSELGAQPVNFSPALLASANTLSELRAAYGLAAYPANRPVCVFVFFNADLASRLQEARRKNNTQWLAELEKSPPLRALALPMTKQEPDYGELVGRVTTAFIRDTSAVSELYLTIRQLPEIKNNSEFIHFPQVIRLSPVCVKPSPLAFLRNSDPTDPRHLSRRTPFRSEVLNRLRNALGL